MLENLGQVLPDGARRYGEKTALVSGGREFSFHELNELSGRLANGLRDLGVAPGDRVSLYSQNSWEWIVSYYAIARLGAVINPIIPALTPEEALFIVNDCGAKAVLASEEKGGGLLETKDDSLVEEEVLFGDPCRRAPGLSRSFWSETTPSSRASRRRPTTPPPSATPRGRPATPRARW